MPTIKPGRDDFHVVPIFFVHVYGTTWKSFLPIFSFSTKSTRYLALMPKGEGTHRDLGRQTPAPGAHIFLGQPNVFFVTVNAKDAVPWMANPTVQNSLTDIWRTEASAWLVGYYLVMPNHVHLFCAPHDLHFGIDQWVAFWKSRFSRRHLEQAWSWQRKSFHHRLRNRIEYEDKLTYVRENPLRKQLVARPEEWPYQGRVHDLRWTSD
jgi:putative transposase